VGLEERGHLEGKRVDDVPEVEAVGSVGDDERVICEVSGPVKGAVEQRVVAQQLDVRLGERGAAEGPQAGTAASAEDDRDERWGGVNQAGLRAGRLFITREGEETMYGVTAGEVSGRRGIRVRGAMVGGAPPRRA
jgi:hypothetical protein